MVLPSRAPLKAASQGTPAVRVINSGSTSSVIPEVRLSAFARQLSAPFPTFAYRRFRTSHPLQAITQDHRHAQQQARRRARGPSREIGQSGAPPESLRIAEARAQTAEARVEELSQQVAALDVSKETAQTQLQEARDAREALTAEVSSESNEMRALRREEHNNCTFFTLALGDGAGDADQHRRGIFRHERGRHCARENHHGFLGDTVARFTELTGCWAFGRRKER
jgi:hypothetical protein